MKHLTFVSALLLLCNIVSATPSGIYNVKSFGAKGDGKNIDSKAINKAIESASAAGGGTVYFPAGTYLSYSIRLKDNITLHLGRGAILKAAEANTSLGYDIAEPNESAYQDFGHSHWKNSLIWGIGLHDVSITGFGLIDGSEGLSRGLEHVEEIAKANKAIALKDVYYISVVPSYYSKNPKLAREKIKRNKDTIKQRKLEASTNKGKFSASYPVGVSECQGYRNKSSIVSCDCTIEECLPDLTP